MLKDTLSHAQLSIFTEIATVLAIALFVGVVFYLFVFRAKASWQSTAELPLHDEPGQTMVSTTEGAAQNLRAAQREGSR